jgi:hypothetical protein
MSRFPGKGFAEARWVQFMTSETESLFVGVSSH